MKNQTYVILNVYIYTLTFAATMSPSCNATDATVSLHTPLVVEEHV